MYNKDKYKNNENSKIDKIFVIELIKCLAQQWLVMGFYCENVRNFGLLVYLNL